jgi:hypothetical protein
LQLKRPAELQRRPIDLQRPDFLSFSRRQLMTMSQQMGGLLACLTESLSGRMLRYNRCSRAYLPCSVWFNSFSLTPGYPRNSR